MAPPPRRCAASARRPAGEGFSRRFAGSAFPVNLKSLPPSMITDRARGVAYILTVVVVWVASGELIQVIENVGMGAFSLTYLSTLVCAAYIPMALLFGVLRSSKARQALRAALRGKLPWRKVLIHATDTVTRAPSPPRVLFMSARSQLVPPRATMF